MLHNPEYRLKSRHGQDRSVNHRTTLERLTRAARTAGYTVCSVLIMLKDKVQLTQGNQNVSYAHIFWAGALTCSNCRLQGVMNAIA